MYFCAYFYLAFDLNHLRFFALYGAFLFILAPFLLIFIGGYLYSGDLDSSRKFLVIIPFLYGVGWLYNVGRAFHIKYFQKSVHFRHPLYIESMIAVYLALVFWMSLPVVVYFDGGQILEQVMTNIGFLIMTISYIRIQVKKSNAEYRMLMLSSGELEALDEVRSKLKKEVDRKNTEMVKQAMILVRNKDFIKQITDRINKIHHAEREIFKPITKVIDKERSLEEELAAFYKIFDHEHNDFHKKLTKKHPDLTLSEKRHLSYLKLDMSNQEIAHLLGVSLRTLRESRYKLRKKLCLAKEVELSEWVKSFGFNT